MSQDHGRKVNINKPSEMGMAVPETWHQVAYLDPRRRFKHLGQLRLRSNIGYLTSVDTHTHSYIVERLRTSGDKALGEDADLR